VKLLDQFMRFVTLSLIHSFVGELIFRRTIPLTEEELAQRIKECVDNLLSAERTDEEIRNCGRWLRGSTTKDVIKNMAKHGLENNHQPLTGIDVGFYIKTLLRSFPGDFIPESSRHQLIGDVHGRGTGYSAKYSGSSCCLA
jgi:hypothetical protein